MKIAFSFFLLIYSRCGAPASWAARHTIVCLDNTPVSFLVDTGAGVSLLNKEVWDKLRQAEDMLKPVVTQRIVGVDGIPIRIEGSVSVPVTIGKATFNHEFIVANGITAEAILGLDILEAKKCVLDLAGGKIQITDQTVTLTAKPTQSDTHCAKVSVLKKTTIPPGSEMEIMTHILQRTRHLASGRVPV